VARCKDTVIANLLIDEFVNLLIRNFVFNYHYKIPRNLSIINPYDDTYFMKRAMQEAEMAYDKGEVPIGAVIVINNQIIARSHNLTETLNDVTAHAEMQAITAAANYLGGKYLIDCTLYVTIEPCQMCAGALFWSQISKIVYGARDEQRGCIALNTKLHPKTEFRGGVMADEASKLLKRFFIEKRNLN
jgi:tRNA(adenine34) deaminase